MAEIGDIFGRYRVMCMLGHGGMSRVYKVRDLTLGVCRAMKEVDIVDEALIDAMLSEIDLMRKIHHPLFPDIIDIIRDDKRLCIIMEYIDGWTLKEYKNIKKTITEKEVLHIALKICEGLTYLHSRSNPIIYRDLKPSNVMISRDGYIKLIDFGERDSKYGVYITKDYSPKEVIRYACFDERSDIFSLGRTLEYLLDKKTSKDLKRFLGKCMNADPDKRYQSAKDAKKALEKIIHKKEGLKSVKKKNTVLLIRIIILSAIVFMTVLSSVIFYRKKLSSNILKNISYYSSDSTIEQLSAAVNLYFSEDNYLFLLDEIKKDGSFSKKESELVESILERHSYRIKKYPYLLYETGILYFYYYDDDSSNDLLIVRAVMSHDKFFDACNLGIEDAKAYEEITTFLMSVNSMIIEGKDKGMYRRLFGNLNRIITASTHEEDIMRLTVYDMTLDMLYAYSADFYREGIDINDMRILVMNIGEDVMSIENTGKKSDELKLRIDEKIPKTEKEIENIKDIVTKIN